MWAIKDKFNLLLAYQTLGKTRCELIRLLNALLYVMSMNVWTMNFEETSAEPVMKQLVLTHITSILN